MTYRSARYNVHGAWTRQAPRPAGAMPARPEPVSPIVQRALDQIERAFGRPA